MIGAKEHEVLVDVKVMVRGALGESVKAKAGTGGRDDRECDQVSSAAG